MVKKYFDFYMFVIVEQDENELVHTFYSDYPRSADMLQRVPGSDET